MRTVLKTGIIPFTLASLTTAAFVFATVGMSDEYIRAYIRLTSATSLLLFGLAWSASSINILLGGRWRRVCMARRRIGIAFAISHTFHLAAIWLLVQVVYGGDWSEFGLLAGGAVYVLIYLMAFTSNDWSVHTLGPTIWKRLHWVGGYVIWGAFAGSYIGNLFTRGTTQYLFFSVLCLALFGVRLAAWRRSRLPMPSSTGQETTV